MFYFSYLFACVLSTSFSYHSISLTPDTIGLPACLRVSTLCTSFNLNLWVIMVIKHVMYFFLFCPYMFVFYVLVWHIKYVCVLHVLFMHICHFYFSVQVVHV